MTVSAGLLDGRVAIVTGGAGNLGAHICRLFAAQGASVVINDVNAAAGEALTDEVVAGRPGRIRLHRRVDRPIVAGGRALVRRAVDEFGTVDTLALLAGRRQGSSPLRPPKALPRTAFGEWGCRIGVLGGANFHRRFCALGPA